MNMGAIMPPTDSTSFKPVHGFALIIHKLKTEAQIKPLTLADIAAHIGPQGHGFLVLFLIIPFIVPVSLPGLSTPFGLAVAAIGISMARDIPLWLPERLGQVEVRSDIMLAMCTKLEKVLRALERLIRPRARSFFTHSWFRRLNGLIVIVHGLLLSLPLPIPFSNFFPALTAFFFALGTLEEDLAMIFLGYVAMIINAAFFASLIILPWLAKSWV